MISNHTRCRAKRLLFSNRLVARLFYSILYSLRSAQYSVSRASYSQDGEDTWLLSFFAENPPAEKTYLDIGANDPRMLSNTYLLYRSGWKGVTVEPIPSLARKHRRVRPRDSCINAGIGPVSGKTPFWEMIPHVYSSFDKSAADEFIRSGLATLHGEATLEILALPTLLERNPTLMRAPLLCLDTEGYDGVILGMIPWDYFRPRLVLTEQGTESEAGRILELNGYRLLKSFRTNSLFAIENR